MDENAGLNVALAVNVEIVSAAADAAAYKFAVILEINGKNRLAGFRVALIADGAVNVLSLLGCEQQARISIGANGHIVEIPGKFSAHLNFHIVKFIARNRFVVLARVANGGAEEAFVFLKNAHCLHNLIVNALAAACVRGFLGALNGKRQRQIARLFHILAEFIVNQRAICKCKENAILILTHEG